MTFLPREEPFICEHCGTSVEPLGKGTYRNHCPKCLYSKHVDSEGPGDRASTCHGLLKPIEIDQDAKKGFVIVYKCGKCGKISRNRAAEDDDLVGFLKNNTKTV
jgi:DNA-directed RNA polymerase subunit RPC12/RpoP